jgi:UDP-2,4-diacetamido-2,4,6-trideoxy-beta-L-altropyranose hydrolase
MGTGHVMRMIALAQAWQDGGGEAVFACAEITPALRERLAQEGFALKEITAQPGSAEDLAATCALICQSEEKNPVVALDGYQFDADFQLGLKKAGCRLLVMDDYGHAAFYHADWVLNQNLPAREELYASRAPHTRLLLGTKFALLRREFLNYRGWQRQIPEIARKVLVTLGGADPDNVTGKVIEALAPLDIEVKVVVGGSNPHLPELQQAVEGMKTQAAKIELVINPADMPGLMAWADLAIAAGGSTAWELAFMGLPFFTIILAENQVHLANALDSLGATTCLGWDLKTAAFCYTKTIKSLIKNRKKRFIMSCKSAQLVKNTECSDICVLIKS